MVEGLLSLFPFRHLYIADLDAILGQGSHQTTLESLRRAHPELEFWVDAGFANVEAARIWQSKGLGRPVLGSESLSEVPARSVFPVGGVLSLDFRGDDFLGPTALVREAGHWPSDVIVMTLARVGMSEGPDLARLEELRRLAPACRLYAAGGVRHAADLVELTQAGAAGVLLASALHDGAISRTELAALRAGIPAPGPGRFVQAKIH
ncbi:nickel transporter [Sulfuriferula plumbiphila]|uniref:Nickel transporter n=1 Tax=Sulfuriferula plumbiphila TaxID=171865 RepID=A0A512L626_9PROT|nr:nickel transporter [Sulfuriferula plumbiphila]GEP29914.1 nickel transporter [Sulfuriferula plumbiphila]